MGAELSLLAPTAPSVALSSYIEVLKTVQYLDVLGNTRFLKTIKCLDEDGYLLVKLFITEGVSLDHWEAVLKSQAQKLSRFNNVMPYTNVFEIEQAGYLVRQFTKNNLYDRLNTRPFLNKFEKKWLMFQLLKILVNIHSQDIQHGDIKLENFLVTSWNWILLTDFAPFKPVLLPQDNPSQFSFFFDTSQRRICYIAPERFDDVEIQPQLTPEMDIFSLGCVIAELYLDGTPIFTLSQLYKYKKAEYVPDLSDIDDVFVRQLIREMIDLDASKRPSAEDILKRFQDKIFPRFFYDFLYDYVEEMSKNDTLHTEYSNECDWKIDKIYRDYNSIAKALGYEYPVDVTSSVSPLSLMPLKVNLGQIQNYTLRPSSSFEHIDNSGLIILNLIFSNMRNTSHSSFRIKCCELILAISERINDEYKLDRVLPYLVHLLDDLSIQVKCLALRSITQLLLLVDSATPLNVLVFPEYLIPKLNHIYNTSSGSTDSYVKLCLASCLPYLSQSAMNLWSMTQIFKNDIFMTGTPTNGNAAYGNGVNGIMNDPETENGVISIFDQSAKKVLYLEFENLTVNLLTDYDYNVKIALLNNILPLCDFFGRDRTNDIILSHLITYVNDKNPVLRVAFTDTIIGIGVFIGPTSLEMYLLPLLIQTLYDPEEFVILGVLRCFTSFNDLGLIRKSYYWDLLRTVMKLTLHPNEWIRHGVLNLVLSIVNKLSLADIYCFVYPIIRPFLEYDLTVFTWESLYPCLCKPLSRSVYNLSFTWCLKAGERKTNFWKQVNVNGEIDVFGNRVIQFVRKAGNNNNEKNLEYSLSAEDTNWLGKLKSAGLIDNELWKLAILREYIFRVTRLSSRMNGNISVNQGILGSSTANNLNEEELINELRDLNIFPRNVFFDTVFKAESFNNSSAIANNFAAITVDTITKTTETQTPLLTNKTDITNSLVFGTSKAKPSIQMYSETAFGELELIHDDHQVNKNVISEGNKIITTKVTNSYQGKNPYIIKYLESIKFEPSIGDFSEFGSSPYLTGNNESGISGVRSTNINWKPKGTLVAHLAEHNSCINCLAVSPNSVYFLSGSDDGYLKLWNTIRLEKTATGNSSLSLNLDSPVLKIKFIEGRDVFSVTTKDGKIRIYRTEYLRKPGSSGTGSNNNNGNSNGGANNLGDSYKFMSFKLIREYKLGENDGEYGVGLEFLVSSSKSILVVATSHCRIIGIEIITMTIVFEFSNPVSYGNITSLVIGKDLCWLLLGTSQGYLSLWDLRFEVLARCWKFLQGYPILEMRSVGDITGNVNINNFGQNRDTEKELISIIGGTGDPEATIWDISKGGICRQVYRSWGEGSSNTGSGLGTGYRLMEVKIEDTANDTCELNKLIESGGYLNLEENEKQEAKQDNCLTALAVFETQADNMKQTFLITSTKDHNMTSWNLNRPDTSSAFSGKEGNKSSSIFVSNQVSSSLVVIDEIVAHKKDEENGKRGKTGRISLIAQGQLDLIRRHHDIIQAIATVSKPYEMIISGDRSGIINVYK